MNTDDINDYQPSLLNPRAVRKYNGFSLTQNSSVSRCSLSLKRNNGLKQNLKSKDKIHPLNNENSQNVGNLVQNNYIVPKLPPPKKTIDDNSLGFSAIEDLQSVVDTFDLLPLGLVEDKLELQGKTISIINETNKSLTSKYINHSLDTKKVEVDAPLISVSSNTELDHTFETKSESTIIYNVDERAAVSVSFGINNCQSVDINSKKSNIKRVTVLHENDNTLVDCEIIENSQLSSDSALEDVSQFLNPSKRSAVTVNLEIKKKKLSNSTEDTKVLILNTSAVEKISHVIVQPPNYKLVKRNILDRSQNKSVKNRKAVLGSNISNGIANGKLRQKSIDSYFDKNSKIINRLNKSVKGGLFKNGDVSAMSKNSVYDKNGHRSPYLSRWTDNEASIGPIRVCTPKRVGSPQITSASPRRKIDSPTSHTPRKNLDSIQFNIPARSASTKKSQPTSKSIPHHKIVAGTHFAVDAFSYGDIENVKHYFLTHFHSDHYCGLKKTFNKMLYCSKITADLCTSRLGVSPKQIHVMRLDETIRVEGIEVTAVEANHCPGAVMLVFTLANGKTLLHTGDFRGTPLMESYPIFWNKDIDTIYLDTTYCNPRYDFPTQDQSLEMALYILRQKKMALEKAGKKFSSVLIVCGTYTIGKEKFFLGMSRRVGCSVWACPEKDRVLQAVEGRSFGHAPPQSCQLHVVPMRDLTHEKLRAYLDSLKGTFSEVVAFKPSGWENGKSPSVEKDMVTIHGIPYSEHSSFSELIRFVKFLKPKQVVPTVDISGGVKAVQKYFPCPLVIKEDYHNQSKLTDFFSIKKQQQVPAVT